MRPTAGLLHSIRPTGFGFRDFAKSLRPNTLSSLIRNTSQPKFDLEASLRSPDVDEKPASTTVPSKDFTKKPSRRSAMPRPTLETQYPGRDTPLDLNQSRLLSQIKEELELVLNSHQVPPQLNLYNWSIDKLFLTPMERTCIVSWTHHTPDNLLSLEAVSTMLEAYQAPLTRLLKHRIRQHSRFFPRIKFVRDLTSDMYVKLEVEEQQNM
ncbi:hypothetical protein SeMB42_g04166 [Synchytrium endobioticum]|uniref:Uncharacterized protein n=1 Tax=Synchytrium endobioticum TaxID=286115 RepID=A0A507D0J3_9FUNG|nr:hypothetical protein SeMB42_g04166 [Synchytrium endobioticum]TPX50413.1 hypothetical protein SeLEV6574_g00899 [Synchytrium endobioticum]